MDGFLGPVSSFAVWGSLSASFILSISMFLQAFLDGARRSRFIFLGTIAASIAFADLFFADLGPQNYELIRLAIWPWYGVAVAHLCLKPSRLWFFVGFGLYTIGMGVWLFVSHNIATTILLPLTFSLAAAVHFSQYKKTVGYASWLLTLTSIAHALQCSFYYSIVLTGDSDLVALGYLHYALIALLATVEGWVQLPREIRGKMPVEVPPQLGLLIGVVFIGSELCILASLLTSLDAALPVYIAASLIQMAAYLVVFFRHRHQLVIFTDDVSELLAQRTKSLQEARASLLKKNTDQANLLEQQAVSMQEKNQTIERQRRLELAAQTAGQASHDIQNLIAPMLVSLEQLNGALDDYPHLSHPIKRLESSVSQLLALNDQFLAMSRRGRVEQQPISVHELLRELQERFATEAFRLEASPDNLWIEGAWSQIVRALSNIIQNGFEAAPHAELDLKIYPCHADSARPCHLGFLLPGDYVVFEIQDKGPGIPAEHLEQIWEPFYSSKQSRSRSGSGLGLSVVSAIMDDHKGVVDLRTSASGTVFSLYFPLLKAEQPVRDLAGTEHLLIVDDDPKVHSELTALFSPLGYQVYSAFDGREALRLLQLENIDVAIVDIEMPRSSGLEVLVGFLHVRPNLASLVYTSFVTKAVENKAYAYGAFAVLTKPSAGATVAAAVRDALTAKQKDQLKKIA